ncbi:hypothetical protein L211DRAFT_837903 [Terfezia boudieri ATCC MYA-4762]|uniref:PCI domain-containing protein n=1 Tax=Terfezia boudieri ATCC MYA-4762 TaxID=1051890 RepID=A0A3N4LS08_9PEZI|nr:hypothetical protein L211DRAFT_837903 [Terfezia boudieri ATCC MYA-4762]
MADQKALLALQPFIIQAKNAGPAKAVDIITRATEAPGCFVFSELLELPEIGQLRGNGEYEKYYNLLRIFAYGSIMTYNTFPTPLPPLSPAQHHKLLQLSLITLSSQPSSSTTLSYPHLLNSLSLPTTRALEDLVISSIYASLLTAKLDTAHQLVEVSSTAGRDVAGEEIPSMVATLGNWAAQCEEVLGDLEGRMEGIKKEAVEKRKEREEYEKEVALKLESVKAKKDSAASGAGAVGAPGGSGSQVAGKGKRVISEGEEALGGYEDLMDLDEEGGSQGSSGFLGLGGGRKRKGVKVAANKRR